MCIFKHLLIANLNILLYYTLILGTLISVIVKQKNRITITIKSNWKK